jgi:hypothetical protein
MPAIKTAAIFAGSEARKEPLANIPRRAAHATARAASRWRPL